MVGQPCIVLPLVDALLLQTVVPLDEFDHHHLHLGQSQVLSQAAPGTSAKDQSHQILVLLAFFFLPSLGHKLQRIFEYFRVEEEVDPTTVNKSPFLDKNSSNGCILDSLSLEKTSSRAKYPRSLGNNAVQVVKFFEVLNSNVPVCLDH